MISNQSILQHPHTCHQHRIYYPDTSFYQHRNLYTQALRPITQHSYISANSDTLDTNRCRGLYCGSEYGGESRDNCLWIDNKVPERSFDQRASQQWLRYGVHIGQHTLLDRP